MNKAKTTKTTPLPSIEVKTNYVHKGVVEDMISKREAAGVQPIAILTTGSFSKPAIQLLNIRNIAYAVIPESEIRGTENQEQEKKL